MHHDESNFDRVLAQRLARMIENYPDRLPLLSDYVAEHFAEHLSELIDIAQQGEDAMVSALRSVLDQVESCDLLERLVDALPIRTVRLQTFSIAVLAKLAKMVKDARPHTVLKQHSHAEIMSMLGGRIRESGRPKQAIAVLEPMRDDEELGVSQPVVYAQVLTNLGAAYADIGQHQASVECHNAALQCLRAYPPQKTVTWRHFWVQVLANTAAATMKMGDYETALNLLDEALPLVPMTGDRGLTLRIQLLKMVLLAETDKLEEALSAAHLIEEQALDLEEMDSQAFLQMLIDALLSLGSVLIDLGRIADAKPRLVRALEISTLAVQQSRTQQVEIKRLIAWTTVIEIDVLLNTPHIMDDCTALVNEARRLRQLYPNAYMNQVFARVLEASIKATINDESAYPVKDDIEDLLATALEHANADGPDGQELLIRALHTAGMAFDKLGLQHRAYECAKQAVEVADNQPDKNVIYHRAQRAVLRDGLSRRLSSLGELKQSLREAEIALRLIVPCWRERQGVYDSWFGKVLDHYYEICVATHQPEYFFTFCQEELDIEFESTE